MTEKYKGVGLQEDFWIDKLADKVSKSKIARAILGLTAVGTASQMAACTTPLAEEVAPVNEAVLSGVIGQESVDKLSGNSRIIVENSLIYIANKYAEDEKFVPGTEMIYAVGKGTDSFAWYLAGFKNEDGSVGLRVTDYCDSFVRDNENCQNVERDLLMVEGEGNRLYGYINEDNEQHPILLIDKNGNPIAFDINSSSYAEKTANSQSFVEKIVSIGAMNVQAAAPEATATPQAGETLSVVDTPTVTAEPTATATETPTATPSVEVDELGIRKEFARGEVMTKEEIKANVDWFYNLSDEELNKIVEGNLWSVKEYEGDSRLRDKDGNILKNTEDLGWFYTKDMWVGGGLSLDRNFFNCLYLGTTLVKNGEYEYNVSAYGTKDVLGNRFVVYGPSSVANFGEDAFIISESSLDRVISQSDGSKKSEKTVLENLLNNYQREVVSIEIQRIKSIGSSLFDEESLLLFNLHGGEEILDILGNQVTGDNSISGKWILERSIPIENNILDEIYDDEVWTSFVRINMLSLFKE